MNLISWSKPTSKETGIVLAEAIEAQANSLKNPTLEKFETMIDKAIKSRLEDGQLDECPLTMEDLQKIKGKRDGKHGLLPVLSSCIILDLNIHQKMMNEINVPNEYKDIDLMNHIVQLINYHLDSY